MREKAIEIDLQMTKDGELVALHDDKVDRTTNGEGYVKDYSWPQLQKLDAGSWFNERHRPYANQKYENVSIPSLIQIIEKFGDTINYYIEIKSPDQNPGMEVKLLSILSEVGLLHNDQAKGKVVIQSFSEEILKLIHEKNESIPLVKLQVFADYAVISDQEIEEIKKYADGLGVNYNSLNKKYIDKVQKNNLVLHAYTVNEVPDLQKMKKFGIDGVFTDFLDIKNLNKSRITQ